MQLLKQSSKKPLKLTRYCLTLKKNLTTINLVMPLLKMEVGVVVVVLVILEDLILDLSQIFLMIFLVILRAEAEEDHPQDLKEVLI